MTRRIQRGLEEDNIPDLLVIDGGKGQLKSAQKALQGFPGIELDLISLAKRRVLETANKLGTNPLHGDERVFKAGSSRPMVLKPGSNSYRILTQIRDEAHRFAITFHRKKRQTKSLVSELDAIPGIGPKLRTKLLETFGAIATIKNATINQLAHVPGVSEKLASVIHAWFRTE